MGENGQLTGSGQSMPERAGGDFQEQIPEQFLCKEEVGNNDALVAEGLVAGSLLLSGEIAHNHAIFIKLNVKRDHGYFL
ncbi:Hypothetical protein ABZS17H1_04181 [Kosakonia cowanii]